MERQVTKAPAEVRKLVKRFQENRDQYTASGYNETQLRREFVDPSFTALGWDVANTAGWAEAYKDVVHEDAIKIGGATKAPDYCFRVGGTRCDLKASERAQHDALHHPVSALVGTSPSMNRQPSSLSRG